MRSIRLATALRLATAVFALALVAAACSDDGEDGEEPAGEVTTTTGSATPTTTQPRVTTPTTAPVEEPTPTTVVEEVAATTSTTEPPEAGTSLGPPPPPSNVRCQAGNAENELLVEFDALPNPSDIAHIRVYVSVDGGPMITNGEYTVDQVDTTRSGGDRWAARARGLPANTPLRLAATSFNHLGQESGWYIVEGLYSGPGAPCGEALPPPTGTAGIGEGEGEGEQGT
ncbi:MAG: hypothetical protein F4Z26_07190 [Acidimicrobiaceae bacterium]|nr:hypothetical protein [Acidimicrobiaceae bacterium]